MAAFTYLLVHLVTVAGPIALSFDRRVQYHRLWLRALAAAAIVAPPFLLWDHWFTSAGYWSFDPRFHLGLHIGALPLEEVMFFFTVPFACLFIYSIVRTLKPSLRTGFTVRLSAALLGFGLLGLAAAFPLQAHTSSTSLLAGLLLLWHARSHKSHWLASFGLAFLWCLLPFLLVNGFLTWLPVFHYHPDANLGLRIFSIPVEDAIYALALLLANATVFEWLGGLARNRQALETA